MKDKKRAMGRGLGAILSAESKANVNTATDEGADRFVGNIVEVSIDDISPNPGQPRTHFDQDALESLAASIRALGIIQPITLRKDGEKLIIISGERRFRASKLAGLKTVPAYIRLTNDQEMLEMALVENIQREDLDAIEVALTYQRLLEEIGMTQDILSQRVGRERSTITNAVRLLRLAPEYQNAIRSGDISAGHGRALLSLENEEQQQELFKKILAEKLNVRQAEQMAAQLKGNKKGPAKKVSKPLPNHLRKAEQELTQFFELPVMVSSNARGNKGKVVLSFSDEEELNKILKILQG